MKKFDAIKLTIALLIMASFVCVPAFAQGIPVTDSMSTKQTIKNWFTNIKESKVVVDTMNTAKKTGAAIGTAKKAVSEYVIENKKKIEEKIEKVNEYKRQAEEYKAEYDEYKRQLDEGIAQAQEMKRQAEEGIQMAKDTAGAAKEMAGSAGDIVNSKVSSATGIELGGSSSEGGVEQPQEEALTPAQTETIAPVVEAPASAAVNNPSAAVANRPMVVSRQPFVNAGGAVGGATGGGGSLGAVATTTNDLVADVALAPVSAEAVPLVPQEGNAMIEAAPVLEEEQTPASAPVSDIDNATAEMPAAMMQKAVIGKAQPMMLKERDIKTLDNANIKEMKAAPIEPMLKNENPNIDALPAKKSLRRSFKTSELSGFGSVKNTIPAAFAFALELPDSCTDVNGTFLAPKSICMYCNLSSSKAKKAGAIDECLTKIQKDSKEAQSYSGKDAPKTYTKGKLEMAAMVIAESYKASNKAETFVDTKVAPIEESSEITEQDALSNLVEFNKVVDEQLNGLLQIYSAKLALQSYMVYGKYNIVPKETEDE